MDLKCCVSSGRKKTMVRKSMRSTRRPISPDWLKSQKLHPQFQAFPPGIAAYDGVAKFGLPPHEGWDSHSVPDLKAGSAKCAVRRAGRSTASQAMPTTFATTMCI